LTTGFIVVTALVLRASAPNVGCPYRTVGSSPATKTNSGRTGGSRCKLGTLCFMMVGNNYRAGTVPSALREEAGHVEAP
jgi:hypothetical protein